MPKKEKEAVAEGAAVEKSARAGIGENDEGEAAPFGIEMPQVLKDFSPATAARQLLWAGAILLSFAGICIALVAGISLWVGIGAISDSATVQIDNLAAGISDLKLAVAPAQNGIASAENASANLALSLRNLSSAAKGMGSGIGSLSSLPLVGSALGMQDSVDKINAASAGLEAAAADVEEMGKSAGDERAAIGRISSDLEGMRSSLVEEKKGIAGGFFMMQIGSMLGAAAMATMCAAVLMLALSTGVPKKN